MAIQYVIAKRFKAKGECDEDYELPKKVVIINGQLEKMENQVCPLN